MDNKDYYMDDHYYNDEEIDKYYGNENYNPNYGYNSPYNNPEDYPAPKSKKSKGIITGIVVGLLSAASLAGIGVGIYYLVDQSSRKTVSSTLTDSTSLSKTGEYISERSLSLQFVIQNNDGSGTYTVSCGTGWIINKDKNDDSYYIATNLHVAAILTYPNNNVYSYEDKSSTNYGDLVQSLVGYSTNYNYQNNTYTMNMITVPKPTIVYTTAMDSNWSSLGYGQAEGEAYTGYAKYDLESDFAILKYDFSKSSLSSNSIALVNPNISSEKDYITPFENWLSTYNSNPTMFLDKSIQSYNNLEFSMGGYPADTSSSNNSSNESDNGISLYTNSNYSNVAWREFINFTGNPYNSYTGVGSASSVQNSTKNTPIVYVDKTITPKSEDPWDGGYINGAYGYQLGESSKPGSSGSMLVTEIDGQYYVAGIYWGSTTWTSDFSSDDDTYGAADIFNTENNGTYKGYDLISLSYNYLTNTAGASLYFDPITNQKN